MDLNPIKYHLPEEVRQSLTPDRRERGKYICCFCSSGSQPGQNHDGAFSINPDGLHWQCFSCRRKGDIFDFVALRDGISLNAATKILMEKYGSRTGSPSTAAPQQRQPEPDQQQKAPQDFSDFVRKAHEALKGSPAEEYLKKRGITAETADRFMLGFSQDSRKQPCIVMPHDSEGTYYTTRAIDDKSQNKYLKPAGVPSVLFNADALYQNKQPCFVVESQLCAISIEQQGGSAVALNGTAGVSQLLSLLDKEKPTAFLMLSLDNDAPGQQAEKELAAGLKERQIPFLPFNAAGDCKDPNELLQKDPEILTGFVLAARELVEDMKTAEADRERELYRSQSTGASFADFTKYLTENAGRPPIPTGFDSLDKILNGGLTAALYIMGAISSLGKTSWMLNIADNIAAAGHDVLYFSLEMSRYELIAKSISRISFLRAGRNSSPLGDAFSTFEVLNSQGGSMTLQQISALQDAMKEYQETIGKHMFIFSGINSISVDDVTKAVEEHIRITGTRPVVFIDYLQILAPEDLRSTDKQNTDRAVVSLKNMSATHDIPVFCISSLNRANYSEPISMAAFKESGAIEYGSDVLIGIQLYGVDRKKSEKDNDRAVRIAEILKKAEDPKQPTDLEVKILKNRNGSRGGSGRLLFDKKYNSFTEVPKDFTPVTGKTPFDEPDRLPVL